MVPEVLEPVDVVPVPVPVLPVPLPLVEDEAAEEVPALVDPLVVVAAAVVEEVVEELLEDDVVVVVPELLHAVIAPKAKAATHAAHCRIADLPH